MVENLRRLQLILSLESRLDTLFIHKHLNFLRQARLLILLGLLVLLTACSNAGMEPSNKIVQRGLAVQLSQIQQQLSQQFKSTTPPNLEINSVAIADKQQLVIGNLPAYKVRGFYDVAIKLDKRRVTQPHNPFEIYLQRQQEGKTWRLAVPHSDKDTNVVWRTYSIQ